MFAIAPTLTLGGAHVRLEPLSEAHLPGLYAVSDDPETFRYMSFGDATDPARLRELAALWRGEAERGETFAFAVVERTTGAVAGCTSYLDLAPRHRTLEIGRTWLGPAYRRTAINSEAKYVLLRHAFETLGAIRVQLKTDGRNLRSQAAIERIGATREGVLRCHLTLPDGYVRDSVMYSVIAAEWPDVKARLEAMLAAPRSSP